MVNNWQIVIHEYLPKYELLSCPLTVRIFIGFHDFDSHWWAHVDSPIHLPKAAWPQGFPSSRGEVTGFHYLVVWEYSSESSLSYAEEGGASQKSARNHADVTYTLIVSKSCYGYESNNVAVNSSGPIHKHLTTILPSIPEYIGESLAKTKCFFFQVSVLKYWKEKWGNRNTTA